MIESARRLIAHTGGHDSRVGFVIASGSVLALTALALWKRAVAGRVKSEALRADGWLSATGAGLAIIAVVGTTIVSHDLHWVDPATALVIAVVAADAGVVALRREEKALFPRRRGRPRA